MSDKRKVIVWGGFGEKKSNKGTQYYYQDRIYDANGLCPALTATHTDIWVVIYKEEGD